MASTSLEIILRPPGLSRPNGHTSALWYITQWKFIWYKAQDWKDSEESVLKSSRTCKKPKLPRASQQQQWIGGYLNSRLPKVSNLLYLPAEQMEILWFLNLMKGKGGRSPSKMLNPHPTTLYLLQSFEIWGSGRESHIERLQAVSGHCSCPSSYSS